MIFLLADKFSKGGFTGIKSPYIQFSVYPSHSCQRIRHQILIANFDDVAALWEGTLLFICFYNGFVHASRFLVQVIVIDTIANYLPE